MTTVGLLYPGEMGAMVAATCLAEVGLPDGIARGAADLYARWDEHRDTEVPLERLLDDLRE